MHNMHQMYTSCNMHPCNFETRYPRQNVNTGFYGTYKIAWIGYYFKAVIDAWYNYNKRHRQDTILLYQI